MTTTLTIHYTCDDCGQEVVVKTSADLYGDTTIVLPDGWGHFVDPRPGPDDMLDLCPECMNRYRAVGVPAEDWNHESLEVRTAARAAAKSRLHD